MASMTIHTVSVVDAVAEALRTEAFTSATHGERAFTEASVAQRYDVARPTAKAAIERLVAEGILGRGPNKTARVVRLGPADISDLYSVRGCLEVEVVRRLCRERQVPDGAVAANAEIHGLGTSSDPAAVDPDIRFHLALVDAAGSPRLSALFRTLVGEVRLCMAQVQNQRLLDASVIAAEHDRILDLLRAEDPAAAADAVVRHLARAEERLLTSLSGDVAKPR